MPRKPAAEPKFIDPLEVLLVAELRHGAKIVGADLTQAVGAKTEHRADAICVVAWLLTRRHDPAASLDDFRRLTLAQAYTKACILAGNPPSMFDAEDIDPDDVTTAAETPVVTPGAAPEPVEDPSPPTS